MPRRYCPTQAGLAAIAPRPMSPEEIAGLVERTRAVSDLPQPRNDQGRWQPRRAK